MTGPMRDRVDVVALDLDGTLAGADHRVSSYAATVLRRLQESGISTIVVTGRTEHAALLVCHQAGLTAPAISCNGALITVPGTGRRLRERYLDPSSVSSLLDVANMVGLTPVVWTATNMYADHPDPTLNVLEEINEQAVLFRPVSEWPHLQSVKAMLLGTPDQLDAAETTLRTTMPSLKRSMATAYETANPDSSKKEALHDVLHTLGLRPERCLGIGDGDTDIDWLASIGLPTAVANASHGVLAITERRIGHHADDAVAALLADELL